MPELTAPAPAEFLKEYRTRQFLLPVRCRLRMLLQAPPVERLSTRWFKQHYRSWEFNPGSRITLL